MEEIDVFKINVDGGDDDDGDDDDDDCVVCIRLFNDVSAPFGVFSVKKWTPDRKIQYLIYKIQESRRHWVFRVGHSRYPKTTLKPL